MKNLILTLLVFCAPVAAAQDMFPDTHLLVDTAPLAAEGASNCGQASPGQFQSLEGAIGDMLDREFRVPSPMPMCQDKPPGYQACIDAARADFQDTMSDAVDAAADMMEDALNTAKIKYAIASAMHDMKGTSYYDRRRACKAMTLAGEDAAFAEWAGPEMVMKAYGNAVVDYYQAISDCCYVVK